MYERFSEHYKRDDWISGFFPAKLDSDIKPNEHKDIVEFFKKFNGCSFENGLYRVLDCQQIENSTRLIEAVFPNFTDRFIPFGCDWLGRFFAKCKDQVDDRIFLFSCLMNEVLEIPSGVVNFHNVVLVENSEPALEINKFHIFLTDKKISNLRVTECVDMIVPLYMGGKYSVSNMKILDVNLVWDLAAQLISQLKDVKDGQTIGTVRILTN